ncbi:hypothetical protein KI688_000756 [Linnemannia hyalina]|uniref:Crinkler effector protein N-terminal domain-containing protein n=1 Tax=Linnemannia hyalina TaxID=64524 RepID=A0A9P7Y4X6_9FUNG|nr:hypothetical protein KI688_000756 [Linnemannia hyalina]
MADIPVTLFCLVDGEAISNAFCVKIPSSETVCELKNLIWTNIAEDFQKVNAQKLTLWRVFIPTVATNKHKPIFLDEIDPDSASELYPTDNISDVFADQPPRQNTIRIIVRQPLVLPRQLKSVPKDLIEQELAAILYSVQHRPTAPSVDPLEVEASQNEELGRFFKRSLPHGETARDIKLVMLGLELDKQAKASDGKTLRSIVEDDIGKLNRSVVAMVAPSGSGKTATVTDLATRHFVVYCVCCSTGPSVPPDFGDPNFAQLAREVEEMYATVTRTQGVARGLLDVESDATLLVRQRVELEFLARLLFLQRLLGRNPDLEPPNFFREQMSATGVSTIRELVKVLRKYDCLAIQYMLDDVQTVLHAQLEPRRRGLVIALDEAILAGKFISPSALAAYWNTRHSPSVLFDDKNEIHRHLCRGFLTPLSATLSGM